jgi:pimeloyl-ACP methyl ester carboxylesterase
MLRVAVDNLELEYEVYGAGEPVVLIHAGGCGDWFRGLLAERTLTDRYQLIRYHRVGYAGSDHIAGPVSVRAQAEHCRGLMRRLGVTRAHIVGHSSGGNIALQVALDHPEHVRSLALLEPALLTVPSGPFAGHAMEQYRAGDWSAAVDIWMAGVGGADYRAAMERALPGALDHAVADADTFFGQELPAVREWSFGRDDAQRIEQPVLCVLGGCSDDVSPVYNQRHELLLDWLSNVEAFVLPGATHLLHVQNPGEMAERLASFFAQHPLVPPPDPRFSEGSVRTA